MGQWRGYADDGKGLAIGFSKNHLDKIKSGSFLCPVSNFAFMPVVYENRGMDEFCKFICDSCDKNSPPEFVIMSLRKLFRLAVYFKDKSFKEEKEWRISYTLLHNKMMKGLLDFSYFNKIAKQEYIDNFETPTLQFTTRGDDIISHIAIGIKDFNKAIKYILIGPKCNLSELDVKLLLISKGYIKSPEDKSIVIRKSVSSYR